MDKTTLVKRDVEVEGLIADALSRAGIPVTLWDWYYVPQLGEWQLVVATPWYDSKGPRKANRFVIDALQRAGVYERVPIRRLFVKSPDDPIVKTLERELQFQTEGSIHILKHHPVGYSVTFTPYTGGRALPSVTFSDDEGLRNFLLKDVGIWAHLVDSALSELSTKGNTSIPGVQLSAKRAKQLKLA
jgi:hypothetical protein